MFTNQIPTYERTPIMPVNARPFMGTILRETRQHDGRLFHKEIITVYVETDSAVETIATHWNRLAAQTKKASGIAYSYKVTSIKWRKEFQL